MAPFGLLVRGEEQTVPLTEVSVQAFLKGSLVGFRSKLCYDNNSDKPLEVIFRTPVDDSYAVVGLEAIIDGRKVKASLQEKEKAREMYKDAIERGYSAAFAEEKKGDIFSIVLGNLPQGSKAEIHLTMVGELAVEPDGSVRFVLPTVLKPRYTPAGGTDPLKATPGPQVMRAEGPSVFTFSLVITDASGIAMVTSPSHQLETVANGEVINVNVKEDSPKDIVILVTPREPHKPKVIVEAGLADGKSNFQKSTAVMLSFQPEFPGNKSSIEAACEFIFLVDRSGSMGGEYIKDAAKTLLLFLRSLPEGCYFNIVGFGSTYEKLFPESVAYDQKTLDLAVNHAENLEADLGGTELFDPLKDILSLPQMKGVPRQVFVLTDGSVSNTESVIKLVGSYAHNARCFSFGIGSGASSTLVNGIAKVSHGAAEFIVQGENMQPKVIRALKKAMQPSVTETKIKFDLPDGYTVQVAPKNVPAIFIGETTIIYGMVKSADLNTKTKSPVKGYVCLSGDLLGAKVEHTLHFQIPPLSNIPERSHQVETIHHLAAKTLIKEMECGDMKDNKTLIQLSLDANVISSLTGFIAIDDNEKPLKGSLETWDIMSDGFGGSSSFQSACLKSAIPDNAMRWCSAPKSRTKRKGKPMQFSSKPLSMALSMALPKTVEKKEKPTGSIIHLQRANGAWKLTAELASFIGKTVNLMKTSCPVPCQGDMVDIWATLIALCYLEQKEADKKDEWELVANKASSWLAKQSLPNDCTLEMLREAAAKIVF